MAHVFGDNLRELRLRAGIGLRKFAMLVGELPENMSAIEHGRRLPPQSPERLRAMADVLGLTEGTSEWDAFFDSAVADRPGQLPADVEEMANWKMVPALMRTIKGLRLTDGQLKDLVEYLAALRRQNTNGPNGISRVHDKRNRAARGKPPEG